MNEHMMIRRRPLIVMVVIGVVAVIAALSALPGPAQAQDGAGDSTAELSLSVSEAEPGETITVRGSGFRAETDASFIYTSTITVGGVPIAGVESVDPASGYLHAARTIESGLYIAEHIDIDPAGTAADGAFTAEFVLPHDLAAGDHYLEVTSCWGGPDEAYPEDGVAPCGTVGLGGGVNDRVAMALITILEPADSGSATADEVVGVPGPAGKEGPQGPQGATGPRGPQGPQGAIGPRGPQGLQGATGPRGPQGPQGLDGRDGSPGAIGARGPVGVAGERGPAGFPGVDGRDGAPGPQGLPGSRGPAGSQSPASEALSIIALIVSIVALVGVVAVYVLGRRPVGGRSEG